MAGDWWSNAIGLGQAQQQYGGLLNGWGHQNVWITGATATAGAINLGYQALPPPIVSVTPKAPESALEWLERRVDEMRVSL